jgi:translation initiation factor 2 subunit 2
MRNKVEEEKYLLLLNRLYENLPKRGGAKETQEIPKFEVLLIGPTTIIRNFKDVCYMIRREEKVCMKYLVRELAVAGNINEQGQLVLQGKFSEQVISVLMDRFLKNYVQCSTCKSYDTLLMTEKKVWYIRCLACGAQTPVRPI